MLSPYYSLDRSLSLMDELRRRMDRVWEDLDPAGGPVVATTRVAWPRLDLYDAGSTLVLRADVPGLSTSDLELTQNGDTITLAGERKVSPPEGYATHRQERPSIRFARSVRLPCKVDADKTSATVTDGVLTVTFAKVPEAQPRQISIRAE